MVLLYACGACLMGLLLAVLHWPVIRPLSETWHQAVRHNLIVSGIAAVLWPLVLLVVLVQELHLAIVGTDLIT